MRPADRARRGEIRQFWRTFSRNRLACYGGVVVGLLVAIAVLAPALAPWNPNKPDTKRILEGPSARHWFGTDQIGRDVLSRLLYGSRISLAVGFVSMGIAVVIGILLGALAGYHGGVVDAFVMRLVDLMLGFPRFFLLLAVLSFLGLGVQPPYATWGNILNDGKELITYAWWLTLYPGLAILVTVLSYNLLGEGIRDALDPRMRQSTVGRALRLGR